MRIVFNYFSYSINCLLSNRCWKTTWTKSILNTKFIALKFTKPIKECVVGRCTAPPMLALNGHGNPFMLIQFSSHRKSLWKLLRWELKIHVKNDVTVRRKKFKNATMSNRWKSEISCTILNVFRPHNEIDVLKLPFLEELYEKTFVVPYVALPSRVADTKWAKENLDKSKHSNGKDSLLIVLNKANLNWFFGTKKAIACLFDFHKMNNRMEIEIDEPIRTTDKVRSQQENKIFFKFFWSFCHHSKWNRSLQRTYSSNCLSKTFPFCWRNKLLSS